MGVLQRRQTILYEVQQACIQLNLAPPEDVYESTDETALLMGSVANLAGIMVNDAYDWQMMREFFECVGDSVQTEFDLPDDIARFVDQTGWSTAIRRPVVILNAQQWAAVSSWLSQSFYMNPAVRIMNDQMVFISAPATGDTITFEYIKDTWVIDAVDPDERKALLTLDGDIPVFDWLLMVLAIKVKYLEAKGLDTTAAQSDFNDRLQQLTQKDETAPILMLNGQIAGGYRYLDNFFNSPDTNIGS